MRDLSFVVVLAQRILAEIRLGLFLLLVELRNPRTAELSEPFTGLGLDFAFADELLEDFESFKTFLQVKLVLFASSL